MTARNGGDTTGRVIREQSVERHERLVELVDAVAIRRALSGCPSAIEALTALEREVVIAVADIDGLDRQVTARGLGLSKGGLDWAIVRQRRRVDELTRDLLAASMLRPAGDLVAAVAAEDPNAVAAVLLGRDLQRLAALCVVLASMVADAERDGRERIAG